MTALPTRPPERIASVDAFRGFVMFLMMAEVLELAHVSRALPGAPLWRFLAYHQTHVEWSGCSLHDLIQPSFSFLVGVAVPFSLASRFARGQKVGVMLLHAAWRALLLTALGVFLRSIGKPQTYFTFEDTLSQIGMGYFFLFVLGFVRPKWQWLALAVLLVGYWAAFALYPAPGSGFDYAAVGVPADWGHNFTGFAAHWNKNSNLAWDFDRWFLNLFPREKPFEFNGGGYATLSFIPTLGTMVLGLIAGGRLREAESGWRKTAWMAATGAVLLVAGAFLDWTGVCPSVKRIWTPAWTLFSGGWCFLLLAGFYALLDVLPGRPWSFPLRVVGMNSIAAYCMAHLFGNFIVSSFKTHLGSEVFKYWGAAAYYAAHVGAGAVVASAGDLGPDLLPTWGAAYAPLATGVAVLAMYWLILYWMYRRGIFLRI